VDVVVAAPDLPGSVKASGLVIWSSSTLIMALRRHPQGVAREAAARELDLAAPGGRDELIGEGPSAWLLRPPGNELFRLQ
jgi:hypothetical protein